MGGKRLGHKAELHHGAHMSGRIGIEDLIENGPAIDGFPVRILGVDVGRTPFEIGLAVAGGEQEMGANIDRNRAQIVQLAKQRPGHFAWLCNPIHRSQTSCRWA